MDTVKKFIKYAIWLVICYILVSILSYAFILKSYNKVEDYTVLVQTPKIEVKDSKATNINGYIIGTITNNTGALLNNQFVRVNLYNGNNQYIGTEYADINNVKVNDTVEFRMNYKYANVAKFAIDVTDEKVEKSASRSLTYYYSPQLTAFIQVISVMIILWYVLP